MNGETNTMGTLAERADELSAMLTRAEEAVSSRDASAAQALRRELLAFSLRIGTGEGTTGDESVSLADAANKARAALAKAEAEWAIERIESRTTRYEAAADELRAAAKSTDIRAAAFDLRGLETIIGGVAEAADAAASLRDRVRSMIDAPPDSTRDAVEAVVGGADELMSSLRRLADALRASR